MDRILFGAGFVKPGGTSPRVTIIPPNLSPTWRLILGIASRETLDVDSAWCASSWVSLILGIT